MKESGKNVKSKKFLPSQKTVSSVSDRKAPHGELFFLLVIYKNNIKISKSQVAVKLTD